MTLDIHLKAGSIAKELQECLYLDNYTLSSAYWSKRRPQHAQNLDTLTIMLRFPHQFGLTHSQFSLIDCDIIKGFIFPELRIFKY